MREKTAQSTALAAQVREKVAQSTALSAQVREKVAQSTALSEVSIKSGHGKLRVAMIEITILKDVYRMTKKITQEYRDYVVKLVVEENRKVTELSYELGIGESSIHRWVKKYRDGKKQENGDVKYITPSELKKLEATYEKKLRDLEEENAILKKAMHIFAKNPQ
ncbi:transposase [Lysinibacillus pakistanensis]|uniref:transposase n=1 Tax=Lysinibacillus pakistanensis TaxID=759811 RepID=UPI003D2D7A1F